MARDPDGPVGNAVNSACPLQCWRQGPVSDNPSSSQTWARDHVDWAGLPINLDLAFSTKQRDRVFMQHLMRKRGAQLSQWLPGTARLCVCDAAEEHLDTGTASDYAR